MIKDKGGTWHYVQGNKPMYVCLNDKGEQVGKIYAEYVPDPVAIWEQKCRFENTTRDTDKGKKLRPNPVVWQLFEHAQGVLNANNNN